MKLNSTWHWSIMCGLLTIALSQTAAQAQSPPLPQPESMTVDRSLPPADAAQMIKTARLFYAFWDTGNAEYVSAAVDNDFRDNTLPEGRSQGPKGLLYASQTFRSAVPAGELKYEFDQLYAEAATRRRMMSVSAHDRITGRPARTKALEEFIIYAQKQPGVVFLRKDQIARFALESSATPREGSLIQPRAAA